jgi:hypothetical protein
MKHQHAKRDWEGKITEHHEDLQVKEYLDQGTP